MKPKKTKREELGLTWISDAQWKSYEALYMKYRLSGIWFVNYGDPTPQNTMRIYVWSNTMEQIVRRFEIDQNGIIDESF